MRSKAITKAIGDFIVTGTFFGCFWTWFLTFQLHLGRLQVNLWLLLNPLLYVALAVAALYFYRRTIRSNHGKMESRTNAISDTTGIIISIGIVALFSIFLSHRTAKWMVDFEPADTVVGSDSMILIFVGIISGILVGLLMLAIGYGLTQDGRRRKG